MSVSKPSVRVTDVGKRERSMRLPLESAGDHNGNAFPMCSTSSSSSSSCVGESPESVHTQSSTSSGCTVSPHNDDMLQVTLTTTLMTQSQGIVEDVLFNWVKEDKSKIAKNDLSFEKLQMANELSDSNDNSVSVYLDASTGEHRETRNDNASFALSLSLASDTVDHGDHCNNRLGSSTPDSEATEILADDDDDDDDGEDEALFVSFSSEPEVRRLSTTLTNIPSSGLFSSGNSTQTPKPQRESSEAMSVAAEPRSKMLVEDRQDVCPLVTLHITPEDSSDTTHKSCLMPSAITPVQDDEDIGALSTCAEMLVVVPKLHSHQSSLNFKAGISVSPKTTAAKISSQEKKRLPKLDAKVGPQPTNSSPKILGQNKSVSTIGRSTVPRKGEVEACHGDKRPRPSAGTVRVTLGFKPIQGQSTNIKTSHRTAPSDSTKWKRQSVTFRRNPSDCSSAMDSAVTEEKPSVRPAEVVQEMSDEHVVNVQSTHPSEVPGGECIERTVEAPLTMANVEKPRNHGWVSKLGPIARQQGKSTRLDKAPPPATRPTGPENPRPRQTQTDGAMLREVGQCAGDGSPVRVKHFQTLGVSKSRTPASSTTPGPSHSNSKSTAALQPACGRPVLNAASKLPVKGVHSSLGSARLGCKENNASCKASPTSTCILVSTDTRSDERPSKSNPPVGSQTGTKPIGPSSSCNTVINLNNICIPAVPKAPAMRHRALSLQSRTTAPGLKTPSGNNSNTTKTIASNQTAKISSTVSQEVTKKTSHPLQRSGSARLSRLNGTVDKNKPRDAATRPTAAPPATTPAAGTNQNQQDSPQDLVPVTPVPVSASTSTESDSTAPSVLGFKARPRSRSSPKHGAHLQSASKPSAAGANVADSVFTAKQNHNKELVEKKNQSITQLRKLLVQGNKRVEALATVIQHLFIQREETLKEKKDLSTEVANLRDELVASSQCCERLHKEKQEVRVHLEEALQRLEEQHKEELVQLEDRLRNFYQTEWDKVHKTYQAEADKCRMLMEQQVEELRSKHEAERKNQEASHSLIMESLKQQNETSLQELKTIEKTNLENLEKTLKETETTLSDQISVLLAEKEALNEKLIAEEERRRRILTDSNLRDSRTVYLEQELESLKVVLEMKNNQLHQKEKKLMEMDKLAETNVKLEECLNKVQQENEDYKARMDKHAALSKQLSSEQAILQQTLQKESKVNKRLSMENEELLWKLHNGDLLASPRRLSPTSPFSSPQNSASLPAAAPLSPR
ncbi:mucin-5AC-like isoform X2 [Dunckerocampus dactyliophorus]|uniref:mucin-5AC-like isoform X2 n=1 Tax=Dunckerocampus dactyliophorus TaxID=161453 RepID=UPI002405E286|nr:mucin-5AC-like isoform X2 [Dunckerocampus dactyliophorus]